MSRGLAFGDSLRDRSLFGDDRGRVDQARCEAMGAFVRNGMTIDLSVHELTTVLEGKRLMSLL